MQATVRDLLKSRSGGPAALTGMRRFWFQRRSSIALESVAYLTFMVITVGSVFEILNFLHVNDTLDEAARVVVRDHVLQPGNAASQADLTDRAWNAIREKIGNGLDRNLVTVEIKVYDNPSMMLADDESTGPHSQVGGEPGDMVVVRVGYTSSTALGWLRRQLQSDEDVVFKALAVGRNELFRQS